MRDDTEMKFNLKEITENLSGLAIAAVLSGGVTYWFSSSKYEQLLQEANAKIARLQEAERNALVTKRISEQMEDIAFEQKTLSDRQRARAEEQSRIADIERGKAEMERGLALKAERAAVISAKQADSMRIVAETESERAVMHMKQAQMAQAQADTLFYISLARSLAQNSIVQLGSGERELATLLSYSGWYFNNSYKGDPYKQDLFIALLGTAPDARSTVGHLLGNVRAMLLCNGPMNNGMVDAGMKPDNIVKAMRPFIAVTDYGEIVKITPEGQDNGNGYTLNTLFSDNSHTFRDACMVKENLYVLDTRGFIMHFEPNGTIVKEPNTIILDNGDNHKRTRKLTAAIDDTWMHLEVLNEGELVAAGNRDVAWVDPVNKNVTYTFVTEHDITAIGKSEDMLLVFCKGGEVLSFNDRHMHTSILLQLPKEQNVTSYFYQHREQRHIVGMENGDIYIFDNTGRYLTTLIGHSGRITNIDQYDSFLVTSSYDKNVSIWNISDITALMMPVEVSFKQWPLSFALDKPAQTLQVGLANGDIETVRISIEKNVESTRRHITREFTPQEWDYYIGGNVPFINFKQR